MAIGDTTACSTPTVGSPPRCAVRALILITRLSLDAEACFVRLIVRFVSMLKLPENLYSFRRPRRET